MTTSRLAFLLPCILLQACATPKNAALQEHEYDTLVQSNPPGARIEVDENTVGYAPVNVHFKGDVRREFSKSHDIVVYPTNRCPGNVQTRTFFAGKAIPTNLVFDMNLERVLPPTLDVNVLH